MLMNASVGRHYNEWVMIRRRCGASSFHKVGENKYIGEFSYAMDKISHDRSAQDVASDRVAEMLTSESHDQHVDDTAPNLVVAS